MSWVSGVLLVGVVLLSQLAWGGGEAATSRTVLTIKGMMCGSCATTVDKTLRALPGVSQVTVVMKEDRATVSYNPRQVTPQGMIGVLRKAGYQAVVAPATR